MYPQAYMSLELHDAHEFAWLTAPIRYTAAQDLLLAVKDSANGSCLSSPEGPQVVAEPVLRTIGEIGVRCT